ncbi:hypothetical protein KPH14_012083 [Odynerus spinipes]|uniref:RING-type E3 ubiquitin transferase n=1 Tax=Odynerus spinipes TaxID=1348599 RepID=A0AAD9RAA0_9HYME|nr:hypothetical protein KPH14_012083 [Odynerus spinipes]
MLPLDYDELKRIDTILLCGICYEYMETTVITPCSHNYCSLCIRKYLHYKTQCPACFEEVFEKDLRVNKALDEIKQYFLQLKEKLAKCVQSAPVNKLNVRNCTPSRSQHHKENVVTEKQQSIDNISVIYDEAQHITEDFDKNEYILQEAEVALSSPSTSKMFKVSTFFTPKTKKVPQTVEKENVVMCPVCKVNVSEKNINKHLDDCLKREVTKDKPAKPIPKRKPLPKLVLSLMKEAEIKKKLKELGLSHVGDRKALELRLQRYTTLYNAECDKEDPRSVSELIKQCDEEENVEKKVNKIAFPKLQINRNTAANIIEEERRKYLEMNKDSFDSLISKVKTTEKVQKPSDSDSSFSCPLQMYSSEDPMNFLTVELLSSSNDNNEGINCTVDEEESAIATTGFFHSEMKKKNFVNKRPILSNENPRTSNNASASVKKSCVDKNCSKKRENIYSEVETSSATNERRKKNDDFETTLLGDTAFDSSSNDSIVYNSDSEVLTSELCNIVENTTITESLFMKSKLEKENIKSVKKRCLDNTMNEETNSLKKRQRVKVQTNCLSEKNVLNPNEDHSNAFFNTSEKKFSTKSRKQKEERCVSSTCTPPRKSTRLRAKNNHTILGDTIT